MSPDASLVTGKLFIVLCWSLIFALFLPLAHPFVAAFISENLQGRRAGAAFALVFLTYAATWSWGTAMISMPVVHLWFGPVSLLTAFVGILLIIVIIMVLLYWLGFK